MVALYTILVVSTFLSPSLSDRVAPAPRPANQAKLAFKSEVHVNADGFKNVIHLALLPDGTFMNSSGRFVPDANLGFYCKAEAENGDSKLRIVIPYPKDTSVGVLNIAIGKLQSTATNERVNLKINIILPSTE
ncbi:MAG: hypothetical protein K8U57_03875 [Planctomycetes bacterium]|nr:hypothetical protein [Planctomycetota bacterium]